MLARKPLQFAFACGHVENGKVAHWQVIIKLGFTLGD